jgi:hypothetical protein
MTVLSEGHRLRRHRSSTPHSSISSRCSVEVSNRYFESSSNTFFFTLMWLMLRSVRKCGSSASSSAHTPASDMWLPDTSTAVTIRMDIACASAAAMSSPTALPARFTRPEPSTDSTTRPMIVVGTMFRFWVCVT